MGKRGRGLKFWGRKSKNLNWDGEEYQIVGNFIHLCFEYHFLQSLPIGIKFGEEFTNRYGQPSPHFFPGTNINHILYVDSDPVGSASFCPSGSGCGQQKISQTHVKIDKND